MDMIKEINKTLNENLRILQELTSVIKLNSTEMLDESYIVVCESAESFLGILIAKLNAGKTLDPNDNATRNMFGVLAALDLLRYPQPRKAIDSNSVKAYLDIINGVETATTLNQTEVKLLHNLENMKNDQNKSGMDVRAGYLELAKNNPKELLATVNKLRSIYSRITGKLKTAVSGQAANTGTSAQPAPQPQQKAA